jgi:hypothetical protein
MGDGKTGPQVAGWGEFVPMNGSPGEVMTSQTVAEDATVRVPGNLNL